ncbi:MAG: hypothetical protein GF308_21705 [Candidatus Heimdallarchaeota archaeon]|nr:hypothetical protein [Candidatus Heimdallarchaeota archaeon]
MRNRVFRTKFIIYLKMIYEFMLIPFAFVIDFLLLPIFIIVAIRERDLFIFLLVQIVIAKIKNSLSILQMIKNCSLKKLLNTIHYGSRGQRIKAVIAMGACGSDEQVPLLIDLLEDDRDWKLKRAVIMTIKRIGSAKAAEDLAKVLNRMKFRRAKRAANVLISINSEKALPGVSLLLMNEYSAKKRVLGLRLFYKIGKRKAVSFLKYHREHDPDKTVRKKAAIFLNRLSRKYGYRDVETFIQKTIEELKKEKEKISIQK